MDRDTLLALNDEELAKLCQLEFFKATGNGGQKRNKTSSAVRVRIKIGEITVTAEDCTERSQHQNRRNALKKLRRNIAYQIRKIDSLESNLTEISQNNPRYYTYVAKLLDVIAFHESSLKQSAEFLQTTPNKLDSILKKNPHLYQHVRG